MPEPEKPTEDLESTGFDITNITSKQDAAALAPTIAVFTKAEERISMARSMLNAATHDLTQYGLAVEHDGLAGDILRSMPDDIQIDSMGAEARIEREFLKEIISVLEEARTALNTAVTGA